MRRNQAPRKEEGQRKSPVEKAIDFLKGKEQPKGSGQKRDEKPLWKHPLALLAMAGVVAFAGMHASSYLLDAAAKARNSYRRFKLSGIR